MEIVDLTAGRAEAETAQSNPVTPMYRLLDFFNRPPNAPSPRQFQRAFDLTDRREQARETPQKKRKKRGPEARPQSRQQAPKRACYRPIGSTLGADDPPVAASARQILNLDRQF